MEIYHIYPVNDIKEHDITGYSCSCDPAMRYDEDTNVIFVTHSSFDGREAVEEAKRILNGE